MYMPYMYGRQYELLAVRMMLQDQERDLSRIVPVVEPVIERIDDLRRCIRLCGEADQSIGIIVNPNKHELAHAAAFGQWRDQIWPLIDESPHVVPVLRCEETTTRAEVESFLQRFEGRSVGLLFFGIGMSRRDQQWISRRAQVRWHVVLTDRVSSDFWNELPREKLILLKDCFNRLNRNADYDGSELFTDRHRTYRQIAAGIADYLCIGRLFQPGGGAPGAVVIHATFKERERGDLWVEHFLSDDQIQNEGDLAEKFLQAAGKLVRAARRRPAEFGSNPALVEYGRLVEADKFPQLGTNKKLQMVHHMCVVLDALQNRR